MENAKVEVVEFDSADVIATSGNIRYGFSGQELFRYSEKDVQDYNTNPYPARNYTPDSRIDESDTYAYNYWVEVVNGTDTMTDINGTEFSTNDWTNTTKWLFLNSKDNTWRLVDRSTQ